MQTLNLFEANIIYWIQENMRISFLNPLVNFITSLGDHGWFWSALTVILLLFRKTHRAGICCALALILNLIVVNISLKPLIARARPYAVLDKIAIITAQPGDHSFPSGHSASSFACAWAFFRTSDKKGGVPALVLAGLIALSRMYVGVHYPTDVLSGVVIGILMGEIALRIINFLSLKIKARKRA